MVDIMKKIEVIEDINNPKLDWFMKESETFLKTVNEPDLGYFLAESPNVISRALDGGYMPYACLVEDREEYPDFLNHEAFEDVPVYAAKYDILSRLRGFEMTRGAICIMKRKKCTAIEDVLNNAHKIAILEEVMNPTNLGAVFRSAAALGIDGIFLSKGCADPLFKRSCRVSMGTVFQIPWTYVDSVVDLIDHLHDKEYKVMALALDERAVSLSDECLKQSKNTALVLGTEAFGLHEKTVNACDYTVMIPMMNGVDSLNVAAAGAVAFWELCKK